MFRCPTCKGNVAPGEGCCDRPASEMVRTDEPNKERRAATESGSWFGNAAGTVVGGLADMAEGIGDVIGDVIDSIFDN